MARSSWGSGGYSGGWQPYVSVAERRKQAEKEVAALRKKGRVTTPVVIAGQRITTTFWGKAWCDNLESYSDYATRLPRGRSYVRNGCVVHLAIAAGKVEALVHGSSMYTVELAVEPIAAKRWASVVEECSGKISSLVELLGGKLSKHVMQVVTSKDRGLFPSPAEISLDCSCPDFANMCKHIAAVRYGIGSRLDHEPELLFLLRNVDPAQLVATWTKQLGAALRTSATTLRGQTAASIARKGKARMPLKLPFELFSNAWGDRPLTVTWRIRAAAARKLGSRVKGSKPVVLGTGTRTGRLAGDVVSGTLVVGAKSWDFTAARGADNGN